MTSKEENSNNQEAKQPDRRILVIGGEGTLGRCVVTKLKEYGIKYKKNIEIITGGRKSGDIKIDISSSDSIRNMFETCKGLTDIVNCAGRSLFAHRPSREDMVLAFQSKVFSQMELCVMANKYLGKCNDDRSITLTSGYTMAQFIPLGWGCSAQNSAIHAFVKASAVEMESNIRVNVVCPGLLTQSEAHYGEFFPGLKSIDGNEVADAYVQCVFQGIRSKVLYLDNPNNATYI